MVVQASVSGVHLVDAAYWTVHILRSSQVLQRRQTLDVICWPSGSREHTSTLHPSQVGVRDLHIDNDPLIANTDGVRPWRRHSAVAYLCCATALKVLSRFHSFLVRLQALTLTVHHM